MIDLTPLEVRKKKGDFRRIMRGYDPALVDDFLDIVADRLEQLVRENLTLAERVGRQDQQVSEYRERERALTEALVTAQEMREEIRKQTAREAELSKQAAEQDAASVRARVQQEVASLQQEVTETRQAAQREAQDVVTAAQREARELRAAAEREAAELRAAAERESSQLRSHVVREREREEEAFRLLRDRQQQFLASYRAFLERELAELGALTAELEVAPAGSATASPRPAAPAAPAAPGGATPLSGAAAIQLDDFAAPGDDPDAIDLAFAEPATGPADVGMTDELELEPFDSEPFEPEPLEPEDLPAPSSEPLQPLAAADAVPEEPAPPMELGSGNWATPKWEGPKLDLAEPKGPVIDFGDADVPLVEEEDAAMSQLLRNAEAAGYRVTGLDDDAEELLLKEELPKKKPDEDDGWLESLIDDEK